MDIHICSFISHNNVPVSKHGTLLADKIIDHKH